MIQQKRVRNRLHSTVRHIASALVLLSGLCVSLISVLAQESPRPSATKKDAKAGFGILDTDKDERLTEAEYLQPEPDEKRAAAKRDFHVFDLNRDDALTHEEFLTIPSRIRKEQRGPLPDPVVSLMESRLSQIESQWSNWDGDGDGGLDRDEFTRSGMNRALPGFTLTSWDDWNRDGGQRISRENCRLVLEVAYGLRWPDGQLLRTPSGLVLDSAGFQRIDVDQDGRLSEKEYLAFLVGNETAGLEKAKARFARADSNDDKSVTFAEWSAAPGTWHDAVAYFLTLDEDLDGHLSHDEFVTRGRWWREMVATRLFVAFDQDKDRRLSLTEYRLTPFANDQVRWDVRLNDADNDGRLSPSEFQYLPGLPLASLLAESFRILDLDRDRHLDLDEFPFNIDHKRAPRSAVFLAWDYNRDRHLTLEEIVSSNRKKSSESNVSYEKKVLRLEESFLAANRDSDSGLSLPEFESDAATGIIFPTSRSPGSAASSNRSSGQAEGQTNWRMWCIVGANIFLAGAVAAALMRRQ